MGLIITERGWGGHFIAARSCDFRRNTLIEFGDCRVVVLTVGVMRARREKVERIGLDRYYETMAFFAEFEDPYWEADVSRQINFDSEWCLDEFNRESDNKANTMHDKVVAEIAANMPWKDSSNA